jgi:hypothetical protein
VSLQENVGKKALKEVINTSLWSHYFIIITVQLSQVAFTQHYFTAFVKWIYFIIKVPCNLMPQLTSPDQLYPTAANVPSGYSPETDTPAT